MLPRVLILFLLGLSANVSFAAPVEVVGLFKDRAVVRTARGEELVRVGQTSRNGVHLLKADAASATVNFQGRRYELYLSRRVGGSFEVPQNSLISINADQLGQYRVRGTINRRQADFLVDTGASVVAMSSKHARALGIDYRTGQQGRVTTAQGEVESRFITLTEVNVGGVKAQNVAATVIEGDYPVDILLGMSYLGKVNMQNKGSVLTLSQR